MTGSEFRDAWKRLDVAVIAAAPGAGRAVVQRTGGIGDQTESLRRAAVLSRELRLASEPGWFLRWLPDGRAAIFCGGTQHPKMVDEFGRTGIFHGVALVCPKSDVGAILATSDLHALAWAAVRHHLQGEKVSVPPVVPPLRLKRLPGRDQHVALESSAWPAVRAVLEAGVRPFTAPVQGPEGICVAFGQADIRPGKPVAATRIPDATALTERVLAAWPSG